MNNFDNWFADLERCLSELTDLTVEQLRAAGLDRDSFRPMWRDGFTPGRAADVEFEARRAGS